MQDNTSKSEGHNKVSNYRNIFKATSLFGGVQMYQILMRLIRSKFVAVLLGPVGIGIQGLMHSATDVIKNITSLGLSQSAVRDVAAAKGCGDDYMVKETITVVRKLVWATGFLGMFLTICLSSFISNISFGNNRYTWAFVFLSITILCDHIASGHKVVLQGMRRLKDLAKSSALGLTMGLIFTIPLYYLWGINGIVPALVANSLITLVIMGLYSHRVRIVNIKLTIKEILHKGETMVKMGVALSYTSVLVSLCSFIVRSFIRQMDGEEIVGLYSAGVAITSTYVGFIFSAMNSDFYPRLAAVCDNDKACKKVVSEQGEIGALLLGPLVLVCIVFMPFVITLLYSDDFIQSCDYVTLAVVGMLFRLISWLISVQFIAKGDAKVFAFNETISSIYILGLNLIGYKMYGLIGLGASFILGYIFYFIHVYIVASKMYDFSYSKQFIKIFILQVVFSIVGLLVVFGTDNLIRYIVGTILCFISCVYSLHELNNRIDILNFIKRKR